jgi:glycosyltransferase involved in cell wall biosynthesis
VRPRVSVVVPARNAARTLSRTLAALATLAPSPDEIVLVDNGSIDDTRRELEAFAAAGVRVIVLHEARPGASVARNRGARAATGDVVAFTDADCSPRPDWLVALVAPLADATVGAVAGRLASTPPAGVIETFSSLFTLPAPATPSRHTRWTPWAGGFPTANLAVRRDLLLERLGGFDEAVAIYGEDYDLCARLYATGAAIAYAPDAVVEHQHRVALRPMLRQAFGFGRSHAWLMRRHVRGLWLDLPRAALVRERFPLPVWIDAGSPDKKAAALLALGLLWRPLLALLPLYGAWLWWDMTARTRARGLAVSWLGRWGLVGCLVAKAAAMTSGRWWGSLRYGRACL